MPKKKAFSEEDKLIMESVKNKKKSEKRKRERETDEFDQILSKYASKKIQKE